MPRTKKPKLPTQQEFVGAQMANVLYAIANEPGIDFRYRQEASQLYKKWDSIATFRLNNPIVAAELEQALFPK